MDNGNGLKNSLLKELKIGQRRAIPGNLLAKRLGFKNDRAVRQAVADYRAEQDILHDYLLERCIFQKSATIEQKSLYADYKQWVEDTDASGIGKLNFRSRLQEKGAIPTVGNRNVKIWRGIRLRTDDDDVTLVTSVTDFSESSLREGNTGKTLQKTGNNSNKSNLNNYPDKPCIQCGAPDKRSKINPRKERNIEKNRRE